MKTVSKSRGAWLCAAKIKGKFGRAKAGCVVMLDATSDLAVHMTYRCIKEEQ